MTGDQIEILFKVGFIVGGIIVGAVPAFIAFIKARKAARRATTEAKKQDAEKDMSAQMKTLISSAEQIFAQVDIVLKKNGESAGPLKKDSVLSKLIAYAASKGYAFDEEYWSERIDEEVEFTRKVNARQ